MRAAPIALACLLLAPDTASPAEPMPDLSKLDRAIRKEPTYTSPKQLYGLAVFGPKAEKRVWMVLDKSKPDGEHYDVLHIDLNADADLTGPGERLERTADGTFQVGDFQDPATGARHAAFTVRVWGDGPDVIGAARIRAVLVGRISCRVHHSLSARPCRRPKASRTATKIFACRARPSRKSPARRNHSNPKRLRYAFRTRTSQANPSSAGNVDVSDKATAGWSNCW